MKIRNGFVSNSSSSSFIIYGNEVRLSDVKIGNKYYAIGKGLGDGEDIIDICSFEMLHALRLANSEHNFQVFEVSDIGYDADISDLLGISDNEYWNMDGDQINSALSKVPGFGIYLSKDNNCSNSIQDIIDRYDLNQTEDDIIKGAKNYYRELKLKRITKE